MCSDWCRLSKCFEGIANLQSVGDDLNARFFAMKGLLKEKSQK